LVAEVEMVEAEAVQQAPTGAAAANGPRVRRPSDLYRFGAAAIALTASQSPIAIYLPAYYGGYVGLAIGQVGIAILIVRLFDICFDPLMGVLLDRTNTRFGQARPWLILGIALLTCASPWLYLAPKGVGLTYLVSGLLVVYAGFSICNVAFAAWTARLVSDFNERNRLWGWVQVFGYFGAFLLFATPLLFSKNNAINDGADIHIMGWLLTLGIPLIALLALVGIPEPAPKSGGENAQRVKFSDYLQLLRLRNVRTIVIADAVLTIATGTTSALFLLFWQYARGYSRPQATILVLTYMVSGFIGTPLWVRIARKTGKKAALMAALACYGVIIPGVALAPGGHMEIVVPGQFLLGLTFASGTFLLRSMAADTSDEIRYRLNKDRTGQLFGLFGSTAKVGTAVGLFYALGLLQLFGFDAKLGHANTHVAVLALDLLYLVAPGLLMLVGALVLIPYRLTRSDHDKMLAELASRDQAEAGSAA
jgi:Na+/melibiose symporter-like transporter